MSEATQPNPSEDTQPREVRDGGNLKWKAAAALAGLAALAGILISAFVLQTAVPTAAGFIGLIGAWAMLRKAQKEGQQNDLYGAKGLTILVSAYVGTGVLTAVMLAALRAAT